MTTENVSGHCKDPLGLAVQACPQWRTTGVARPSWVTCCCDHCCYLDDDGRVTVKPYAFEPKPTWEHQVKNVRGKKDGKRNGFVPGVVCPSLLWAAFGNGLAEPSPCTRLQGADLAFRTKPSFQGLCMQIAAAVCANYK